MVEEFIVPIIRLHVLLIVLLPIIGRRLVEEFMVLIIWLLLLLTLLFGLIARSRSILVSLGRLTKLLYLIPVYKVGRLE